MKLLCLFSLTIILLAQLIFAADVLTYGYDGFRTGANTAETLLTSQNVNSATFGKIFEYPVDGTVVAQPLIATNVQVNGARRNLLIVATIKNMVYAFDADVHSGAANTNASNPIWKSSLGTAAGSGIQGTPVIEKHSNTVYVVAHVPYAMQLHSLDLSTGHDRTGSPVRIEGGVTLESGVSVPFEPDRVDPAGNRRDRQGQRAGLALANGQVIIASGTPGDRELTYGWIFAFGAITLRRTGIFCTSCATAAYSKNARYVPPKPVDIDGTAVLLADAVNPANTPGTRYTETNCAAEQNAHRGGPGGGIWQAGRAPVVDNEGNVYFQTGNKLSCQITEYGPPHTNQWAGADALNIYSNGRGVFDTTESLIRLNPANGLTLTGWFRPRNWRTLDYRDLDLGGSGPLMVPNTNTLIAGGKEHVLYAINATELAGNISRYLAKNNVPSGICDLTGSNNLHVMCDADVPPAALSPSAFVQPGIIQSFVTDDSTDPDGNQSLGNIRHIMSGPVLWSNTQGTYLYIWVEDDVLRRYTLTGGRFDQCVSLSRDDPRAAMASHRCSADLERSAMPQHAMGHPGAALTLSTNGQEPASGILWAYTNGLDPTDAPNSQSYDEATNSGGNSGRVGNSPEKEPLGVLYAYNAQTLQKLWSSELNPVADRIRRFVHFSPPVVANGRVYVAGGVPVKGIPPMPDRVDGKVIVFGLKNQTNQQEHVFYRGTDGAVNHIFWDGSFHHDQWTASAGAPPAAGDPMTMVAAGQQHVFYRGVNGAVNHIFWDGTFQHDQWTASAGAPPAAGDPAILVTSGQQHVFYRGMDGAIDHIFWDGSFHRDQWTAIAGAPPAAGDPVTMVTNGQQHIFYRGTDGAVNHIFWDGSFHHDRWTVSAGAPPAAGDPSAMIVNGQQHIFYRGTDGAINHIFWDGSFHYDPWTARAGAPPAAGDPTTMLVSGQQHVFYRGTDGAIDHIFWDGSFHYDQWTVSAAAAIAAGNPATMITQ